MLDTIIFIIGVLTALSIHEAAHAWMSDRLGDPTAKLAGRLTLNPLTHLDPLGTLALFFFHVGWGKPVPFDPYNLRNPRRDSALISLSGPTANLILAVFLSLVIRLGFYVFVPIVVLNVTWALFNLIPVHPLDGGKVLVGFLPQKLAYKWDEILHQYGIFLLIFLIFPFAGSSPLSLILYPLVRLVLAILLPGSRT